MYRVEAVGLSLSNETCRYFVNKCFIKVRIYKSFCTLCDRYNCDYLSYTTFRFHLIEFQLNTDFPSQFRVFYRKIT